MTQLDVAHLTAGDYVVTEFQQLERSRAGEIGMPTGLTYILEGAIKEYSSMFAPDAIGLAMPNGQSVRQTDGSPGGNLVRIISHRHEGATQ